MFEGHSSWWFLGPKELGIFCLMTFGCFFLRGDYLEEEIIESCLIDKSVKMFGISELHTHAIKNWQIFLLG